MMKWLQKILLRKHPHLLEPEDKPVQAGLVENPEPEVIEAVPHTETHGRILKAKRPEYDPDLSHRKGGKVVKAMPRSLRKMKEAAEDE